MEMFKEKLMKYGKATLVHQFTDDLGRNIKMYEVTYTNGVEWLVFEADGEIIHYSAF